MANWNLTELSILDWIQNHMRSAFLDGFFSFVTHLGDAGIFWIALAVLLLLFKKTRKTGIMMGLSLLLGLLVCNLTLKPLVARIRPYDINNAVTLLIEKPHDFSFPSGHTQASFGGAMVLFFRDKRLGIPAVCLAVLIAFSRMYLYVHYPTDVLTAAVLGTVFAFLSIRTVDALFRKFKKNTTEITELN